MKKLTLATIIITISMSLAGCNNAANNENNNKITVEEAKEIALNHANLTNDEVSFIRTEVDLDNEVEKYDIEFYHENKEYDYEINAVNGEIIEYDYDVEDYNIPSKEESNGTAENQQPNNGEENQQSNNANNNQQSNNGTSNGQSNNQQSNNSGSNQQPNSTSEITLEEAKQIALNHANLTSGEVTFIKSELDTDDGIRKYDIEFHYGNKEYDYEIDANTGKILSYEQD